MIGLAVCFSLYVLGVWVVLFARHNGDHYGDDTLHAIIWPLLIPAVLAKTLFVLVEWPVLLKGWWISQRKQ